MAENWAVQVSLKTPAGTLINLRAETGASAERQLEWVTENAPNIVAAEKAFAGVAVVAGALPVASVQSDGPGWSQQGSQQSAQPAPVAQGPGRQCVHGPMVAREGTSAKGPWKGFFCPLPQARKSEQCSPEFVR